MSLFRHQTHFFISVNADIPTLNSPSLPVYLCSHDDPPTIFSHQACKKLLNLNPNKSSGPDHIPARIVKEFAYEFADPLTDIFKRFLSTGVFPAIWKDSYITFDRINHNIVIEKLISLKVTRRSIIPWISSFLIG